MDCSTPGFPITNSWSLLKLMSMELVMPFNHLIFCCPLLLLPSIFPSIRIFSNVSALCIRWPKYWSFTLQGSYGQVDWGATMALIFLGIVPVVIFYLACQKHIIKGVAAGAVKG